MARLQADFLDRVEAFCDRVVRAAGAMKKTGIALRVVDQLLAAGTSVGANLFEADEAMSRKDFCKCACIAIKELNETRFWLRLAARNGWLTPTNITKLESEAVELKRILGAMVSRTINTKTKRSI